MKEIRAITEEIGIDPKTGKQLRRRLVVLRDSDTLQYEEIDVSDKHDLTIGELIKLVKEEMEKKGVKVKVARHLKLLESEK